MAIRTINSLMTVDNSQRQSNFAFHSREKLWHLGMSLSLIENTSGRSTSYQRLEKLLVKKQSQDWHDGRLRDWDG